MGRLFRIMDDDNSNSINFNEFKKGLQDYGVPLRNDAVWPPNRAYNTSQEYKAVFDQFDKNHDGGISFDEFLQALRVAYLHIAV
jgi:Ca2+-binding EF-hand superfamily protein